MALLLKARKVVRKSAVIGTCLSEVVAHRLTKTYGPQHKEKAPERKLKKTSIYHIIHGDLHVYMYLVKECG